MIHRKKKREEGGAAEFSVVSDFKSGCDSAFLKLYHRFQKPIVYYVKTMIRDAEVAEELVQEIFLKVFRFRGQYNEAFAFSTWLWTIARNTVRDHQRGMRFFLENEVSGGEFPVSPDDCPCDSESAEMLVVKKDQRRSLRKAFRLLSRPQRRVLWLRVVRQLSYDEIAKVLGLSLASVKSMVHRAKRILESQGSEIEVYG